MSASTQNLRTVPSIERLRRQMQAIALLDAILEAQWESRYSSFDSRWSRSEQMGSMRMVPGMIYSRYSMKMGASCAASTMNR
jgi:hypothetical protein